MLIAQTETKNNDFYM